MTAPDSRPVLDVIADTVAQHRLRQVSGGTASGSTWCCSCGDSARTPGTRAWAEGLHAKHVADAVLAACQGATVAQQAELVGGEVEWWSFFENGEPYSHIKPYRDFINGSVTPPAQIAQYLRRSGDTAKPRAVGPWREDPS